MDDNSDIKRDFVKANGWFGSIVLPALQQSRYAKGFGGRWEPMIGEKGSTGWYFDVICGIDAIQFKPHNGDIQSWALRVQEGKQYDSFTVRYAKDTTGYTEYQKRQKAIEDDSIRPHYVLQAYIDNGRLLSAGWTPTDELMRYLRENDYDIRKTSNADFIVAPWRDMRRKGYNIYTTYTPQTQNSQPIYISKTLGDPI